jgi:glycosyltransferase involved in cell wall biosynthesis
MNVRFYMSDSHACGYVRGIVPGCCINRRPDVSVDYKGNVFPCDRPKSDLMVFQRQETEAILGQMRMAKSLGISTCYEIDDDMFNMPPEFGEPAKHYDNPQVRSCMAAFLNECDGVTVSTRELAEQLSPIAPKQDFIIVPNSVDGSMWDEARSARLRRIASAPREVTIGYFASGSHMMDAPLIESVRLLMIGFPTMQSLHSYFPGRVTFTPWVLYHDLPAAISNFDIALAPLKDNPFNRAKSNQKYLETGILEIPLVASDMPCYAQSITHAENGMLCHSSADFEAAICALVASLEYRLSMGASARANVYSRWLSENVADSWVSAWSAIVKKALQFRSKGLQK